MAPVQLLVLGQPLPDDGLAAELDALRETDGVRLLDFQAVRKDADGDAELVPPAELRLPDAPAEGAMVRALLGTGVGIPDPRRYLADGGWYWFLDDQIPPLGTAVVVLLEHRWSEALAQALTARGGALLHDAWVHPSDLPRPMTTRNG